MLVLVTGGTGTLGRALVSELLSRAHAVRVLTRRPARVPALATAILGDIRDDRPLAEGLDGVEAVAHCATDLRYHRTVDAGGTDRLTRIALRSGSPHIVYPGIVGSEVVPLRYYRSKLAAESSLIESGLPISIIRATQFHQVVWDLLDRLSRMPVLPVPKDTRFQPIDRADVARILVDRLEQGPHRETIEVGGPNAHLAEDLARSHRAATGHGRRIVRINLPGITGAAWRAGAALTPNRLEGGRSWNDHVATRMQPPARESRGWLR